MEPDSDSEMLVESPEKKREEETSITENAGDAMLDIGAQSVDWGSVASEAASAVGDAASVAGSAIGDAACVAGEALGEAASAAGHAAVAVVGAVLDGL